MLIDTHCHIDQFDDPLALAQTCEKQEVLTVAVTSLPAHYLEGLPHLRKFRHVRQALGMHPLLVGTNTEQLALFEELVPDANFVGEIGIDGSREGRKTVDEQIVALERIIDLIRCKQRFVTVHSRGAVGRVLDVLEGARCYPVVFHWFSGTTRELERVCEAGHYLSFNPRMARLAKWRDLVPSISKSRILTETDGPFCEIDGKPCRPFDVQLVVTWLAELWDWSNEDVRKQILDNFSVCRGSD